jgi:hypothetical protein
VLQFPLSRAHLGRLALKLVLVAVVGLSLSSAMAAGGPAAPAGNVFESLPQEQIFGAEIQYFRLRGGHGPNIPRAKVLQLWAKVLDAAKEAGMNMVSFYIPWDFHEPREGKFDFDGKADEDGDGNPDYPSRDVKTFIHMIKERGFKYVLVRPGPYILAEWGHLGYGAVPLWFERKYPDSHMHNALGLRTKLFDYNDPEFLQKTQDWFKNVYEAVIKPNVGPGQIIHFVQIDNETNFLWQSIFLHDYSMGAVRRYRDFLKTAYFSLAALNARHRRSWRSWDDIEPPTIAGINVWEDQDWYRFHDKTIHDYLCELRRYWEDLGLHQPDILFTLAESYNAERNGLLPNYLYRNEKSTGLMTIDAYPKTEETANHPFLNEPFKVDHDVIAEESASESYFGPGKEWVMGPEVQGGWFRGTNVSVEARQQTYLSAIGHGMKAMVVYYFHEGENWDSDWARQQIQPFYDQLREEPRYRTVPQEQLPEFFWTELQKIVDDRLMFGFKVRDVMTKNRLDADQLYFDAPLDEAGNPRDAYRTLRDIGQKIVSPHAQWLARAASLQDPVCLLKDVREQAPSSILGIDSNKMNSEWAAALIGYALNANVNMKIIHWGINSGGELDSCQVIFHQDGGIAAEDVANRLAALIRSGHVVVNLLADSLAAQMGVTALSQNVSGSWRRRIEFLGVRGPEDPAQAPEASFTVSSSPLFEYMLPTDPPPAARDRQDCFPAFRSEVRSVTGYGCLIGQGVFYQLGIPFYDVFNSENYTSDQDIAPRLQFMKDLLQALKITPRIEVSIDDKEGRIVAFGRRAPNQPEFWVTVKSARESRAAFKVRVRDADPAISYVVQDLLSDHKETLTGQALRTEGFDAAMDRFGSTVYWIEPVPVNAPNAPT